MHKAQISEMDKAVQALANVYLEFKNKCEELEQTKNNDLRAEPTLPTMGAALEIECKY